MEPKLWKFIKHTLELLNKAYDVSTTHLVKRDPEKKKKKKKVSIVVTTGGVHFNYNSFKQQQ